MQPRLLFLNRSYWPDTEATGQLLTALCEGLAEEFDVHVLAGQPNVSSTDRDWSEIDKRNGVTIHRVCHTTFSKKSMLGKAVNFLSFVIACRRQVPRLPSPDVVIFETDPFLLPFVARQFHSHSGCRVVGYLQDIYPDVAVALRKVRNNWAIRRLRKSLFSIYRRCSRLVVLSDDMRELLVESGVADKSIVTIPNWADTDEIVPVDHQNQFREKYGLANKFVVMYSGNIGLTQRLEEFVDAAGLLADQSDIHFVFVGRGARRAELQRQADTLSLKNVTFCDYQPLNELSQSLGAGDLHLIPLTAELCKCLMPSKLYGILAAGRPYLTNAPESSELHRLTTGNNVGFAVPAGSPQAIADAITAARDDRFALQAMGREARRLAEERYSKTQAIESFAELLNDVVGRSNTRESISTDAELATTRAAA